jgi:competence ComEA-like helix-hairpin-helix protein
VIYLIFQSERNRLAGMVQFTSIDDERVQEAYTASVDTSWSILSQSNLSFAPTYLAPFGVRWTTGERTLENGSLVNSLEVEAGITDVLFDDEMGGEMVSARYQDGQPWPTMTMTNNMTARLISEDEVSDIRGNLPNMLPDVPENFDYRDALRDSINLDRSTKIDEQLVNDGEITMTVHEGYRPWAGAWWPLKKGELIFGYEYSRDTFSGLIRNDIDPLKRDMDELSKEIRELRKDNENNENKDTIKEKRDEYTEKQEELVEMLNDFYDDIRSGLDGGKIIIADGKITKANEESEENNSEEGEEDTGWSFDLNELSPMDKFAVVEYLKGNRGVFGNQQNPFYISSWEILNSYNPGGDSWWGHCNGWAAAAILTNEPRESITVEIDEHSVEFTTADIKGLLTESHYSTHSHFYGERYNGEDDDIADLSPEHFHKIITFYLKEKGVPFVFDTTATEAVWNYPAWKAEVTIEEKDMSREEAKLNINLASLEEMSALEEVDEKLASDIIEFRENNGNIQDLEELLDIEGFSTLKHGKLFRTEIIEKTYDVTAKVRLTTDSVGNTHIDSDQNDPNSITKNWKYTLTVNEQGTITGGVWADEENHPDFAWAPYSNPKYTSSSRSENPYLSYKNIITHFGEEIERK